MIFALILYLFFQNTELEFREFLEPKSTMIEVHKKEMFCVLRDSNKVFYKVRIDQDFNYKGLCSLLIYKSEKYTQHVSIGEPLQFYTGRFFNPWVTVP